MARHGTARHGTARHGTARRNETRRNEVGDSVEWEGGRDEDAVFALSCCADTRPRLGVSEALVGHDFAGGISAVRFHGKAVDARPSGKAFANGVTDRNTGVSPDANAPIKPWASSGISPRRSRWFPVQDRVPGLRQTVPASAEREAGRMTALSLTRNVREHRFQMHHYRGCARDPLKN
jgi:hypothetical protein